MRTEDGRSETPLHLAVKKGNLNLLRLMINEYNVPVVVKDAEGTTPMHLAV
jgi:ankyrin repeat protein